MSESKLMRDIMEKLSNGAVRLFRNNVGVIQFPNGTYLRYGLCNGSSDLIGWRSITITPEMVGKQVAIFTALEIKDGPKKRATKEQVGFLTTARSAGSIAETVFSIDTAQEALACKRLFKRWPSIQHLNQDDDEDMLR